MIKKFFKRKIVSLILIIAVILFWGISASGVAFTDDIRVLLSTDGYTSMNINVVGDYYLKENPDFDLSDGKFGIYIEGNRPVIKSDDEVFSDVSLTFVNNDYDGKSSYIGLYNSYNGFCTYLGNIQIVSYEKSIRIINTLPLETYLYGVVPYEMSNRFPLEALKAQAVCARGYAAVKCAQNYDEAYDIVDTPEHQVYCGYASINARAAMAVELTKGEMLAYDGEVIEAFYTASNGGQTELTSNVWLSNLSYYVQKDDIYDVINPSSPQEVTFIPREFNEKSINLMDEYVYMLLQYKAKKQVGQEVDIVSVVDVRAVNPLYEYPSRAFSGTEIVVMVIGSGGKIGQLTLSLPFEEIEYSEENTQGIFNDGDITFELKGIEKASKKDPDSDDDIEGWYLTNRRYGHGVGMSQRGAQQRATSGQSYVDILEFYFDDTDVFTFKSLNDEPEFVSGKYQVGKQGIYGDSYVGVDEFLQEFSMQNGVVNLVDHSGNIKTQGDVCTGDFIRLEYNDGVSFLDIPVVVAYDIDGDGAVTGSDLKVLQWHMLNTKTLAGAYLSACDVNLDGTFDNLDVLQMIWRLNGKA